MESKSKSEKKGEITQEQAKQLFTTKILDRITGAAKTPKGKTYTILGLTFITFALLMWFAIRPTVKTIIELGRKIEEFERTAQILNEKEQAMNTLTEQYNNTIANNGYSEAITLLDTTVVPSSADLPLVFANMNEYGKVYNVQVTRIRNNTAAQDDNTYVPNSSAVSIVVTATGKKTALLNWIEALEKYPRPLVLTTFTITQTSSSEQADETEEDSDYTASVTFFAYYFSPEIEEADE